MPVNQGRYTAVAIILHWAIAAAIIANLILGWWMEDAIAAPDSRARAIDVFQIHKSLGLTILALSLLRLLWRWSHPAPAMPADMPQWERRIALATHWAFYALMIGIPLAGWLYVSVQWRGGTPLNVPTLWFGLFEVPHLFSLHEAAPATRETLAGPLAGAHGILAQAMAVLLGLHVAAALKHQFVNRDEVLAHMIPALEKTEVVKPAGYLARRITLQTGFTLIIVAMIALLVALLQTGKSSSNAEQDGTGISSSPQSHWVINPQKSRILFTGENAGAPFAGEFKRWRADIRFNPDNPEKSFITATIETGSAATGIDLHEETLPQSEWFDVANHPLAKVRSTSIRRVDSNTYLVDGILDIKGNDVVLSGFKLQTNDEKLSIIGQVTIDRRHVDLGLESDPDGEWVSLQIPVRLELQASRK